MRGLKKLHHRHLVNRAQRRVIQAHRDGGITQAEFDQRITERDRLLGRLTP